MSSPPATARTAAVPAPRSTTVRQTLIVSAHLLRPSGPAASSNGHFPRSSSASFSRRWQVGDEERREVAAHAPAPDGPLTPRAPVRKAAAVRRGSDFVAGCSGCPGGSPRRACRRAHHSERRQERSHLAGGAPPLRAGGRAGGVVGADRNGDGRYARRGGPAMGLLDPTWGISGPVQGERPRL